MATRKTTETEKKVFKYLNELRASGRTNMYGAIPYLLHEFPELSPTEPSELLSAWMENFNIEGNYDEIKLSS